MHMCLNSAVEGKVFLCSWGKLERHSQWMEIYIWIYQDVTANELIFVLSVKNIL